MGSTILSNSSLNSGTGLVVKQLGDVVQHVGDGSALWHVLELRKDGSESCVLLGDSCIIPPPMLTSLHKDPGIL